MKKIVLVFAILAGGLESAAVGLFAESVERATTLQYWGALGTMNDGAPKIRRNFGIHPVRPAKELGQGLALASLGTSVMPVSVARASANDKDALPVSQYQKASRKGTWWGMGAASVSGAATLAGLAKWASGSGHHWDLTPLFKGPVALLAAVGAGIAAYSVTKYFVKRHYIQKYLDEQKGA